MGVPHRIFCILQTENKLLMPPVIFSTLVAVAEGTTHSLHTGAAMEGNNSITPVTDEEQWSDASGGSSGSGTSPQDAGYAPLENYQILHDEDDEDEEEEENQEKEEQGSPAQETVEAWREEASDRGSAGGGGGEGGGGGGGQQGDVASLMLRAMEADYRACVESEERSMSNGPTGVSVTAATAENEPEDEKEQVDDENLTAVQQQVAEDPAGGGEGEEAAAAETPRRPISPLGRDRADRVMRAMQGFALPAPPLPPAGFAADWGSPGAVANLAANGSAGQGEDTTAGRSAPGPNED